MLIIPQYYKRRTVEVISDMLDELRIVTAQAELSGDPYLFIQTRLMIVWIQKRLCDAAKITKKTS